MIAMLFSNRYLLRMFIPLLLEQILARTIGFVDAIMVAGAGESVLSGVSLVGTINELSIYLFTAMTTGGAVIVAQVLGTKDYEKANQASKQLIWASFLIAFAIMTFAMLFNRQILSLAFGKVDADVMKSASVYFFIMVMTYPLSAISNSCSAILQVSGDTKTTMYISLFGNLLNVCGNALLIYGFHLGALGAALASLFSAIICCALRILIMHRKSNTIYIDNILRYKPDFSTVKKICKIGIPSGIENSLSQFGKILTISFISGFGTYQIAANTVAGNLTSFQLIPGGAISVIMVSVVGQCVGAGEKEQAKYYAKKLLGAIYALNFAIALVMCIFADGLVSLYNLSGESSEIAIKLIYLHSIFVCILWPAAFSLNGVFRAASDVKFSMVVSVVTMWVCRVGLSFVFGKYMGMGIYGVWYAMIFHWLIRAIIFGTRFIRGTWLKKYEESEKA